MRSIKTVCFLPQKVFYLICFIKANKLLKNKYFNITILLYLLFTNNIYSQNTYAFRGLGGQNSAGCGFKSISTTSILKASNNVIGITSTDGVTSIDRFLHSLNKSPGGTDTFTLKINEKFATSFDVNDLHIFNYLSPTDGSSDYTNNTKITFKNSSGDIIKTMTLNGTKSLANATGSTQTGTSISAFFDNNNTLPIEGVSEIEFTVNPSTAPVSAFTIKNISLSNVKSEFVIKNSTTITFNDLLISGDSQKLDKAISLAPLTFSINSSDPKDLVTYKSTSGTTSSGAISDNNTNAGDITKWTIKHNTGNEFSLESIYLQEAGTGSSTTGTIKAFKNGILVGTAVNITFNGNKVLSENTSFKDVDEVWIEGTNLNLLIDDVVYNTSSNQNLFTANTENWSDISNWSQGRLPINTDNIIIEANKSLKVDITNATTNNVTIHHGGSLNINEGKALTINGNLTQSGTFIINSDATTNGSLIVKGTSTGNVTYKRHLTTSTVPTEGWHLIGAPVHGQNLNAFTGNFLTNGVKKSLASYANTLAYGSRWKYYTTDTSNPIESAGNYTTAKGYSTKITTAGTLDFTGTLRTNNESITITDGKKTQSTGNRWNLISNPYTASINGNIAADATNNFLKVNIDANNLDPTRSGLYLWDGTNYVEKSIDDNALYIAPGQGFFVHAKEGVDTSANFTKEMQTHQTGNIFLRSSSSYPEVVLHVSNETKESSTKIRYIENKTTGLDIGSDVGTFTGVGSNFKVFTRLASNNNNVDFAIQALPNSNYENMIIPVGLKTTSNTKITFSLNTSNFPSNLKIFLEDKIENTYTRLDELNSKHTVTLTENLNGTGRFYLHTSTGSVLNTENQTELKNIHIYKLNNQTVRITGLPQENTTLTIYNILGKKVINSSFNSNKSKDISLKNLTKGLYIVHLQTENEQIMKKIILE